MTIRIPNHVVNFAGEANLGIYKAFADYWNHYRSTNGAKGLEFSTEISFDEKEDRLNAALKKEIMRVAGISDITQFPLETWASHPTLRWASFAVVNSLVDAVLPVTLVDSIGLYTEIRNIGFGDSAAFDIRPRDLFVVSKSSRGKRLSEIHKQFEGQVTVIPENHQLTVAVSLYKVLSGKESLAFLVSKVIRSLETAVTLEAYNTFATAMAAISNTASTGLRVAGYTQAEFVRLSQTVAAWNGGAKPVAIGTQRALANILPADANYRYDLESDYVKIGFIRNFQNTDIMVLPQVADYETPFGLKLSDSTIWIVSPSSDKLVKLVLEGSTLAYTDDVYKNSNLVQTSVMHKMFGAAIATSAVGATITL